MQARNPCDKAELACAYALSVLPTGEIAAAEAHVAACPDCRRELESLRPVVDCLVAWPTDVLRPAPSLRDRLALRIAQETGKARVPPPAPQWSEPDWEQVAPGIECKLLASDTERQRVSMLVRLAPGASYPAHTHAGFKELHLLDGGLWIDEYKLAPGDYNYGAPGALNESVWERDRLHLRSGRQHRGPSASHQCCNIADRGTMVCVIVCGRSNLVRVKVSDGRCARQGEKRAAKRAPPWLLQHHSSSP